MVMLSGLTLFCALAMLTMPGVIQLVAPGFTDDPQRFALAVELSRITFPYLLAMSLVALLGGVLNAHNRFGPFAFAPVLFNLCPTIGALLLAEHFTTPYHALSWGIAAAGLVQFLWLFINIITKVASACKSNCHAYRPTSRNPDLAWPRSHWRGRDAY